MEEFDSHTEHASEQAHEAAHEAREKWITGVALTAAILAALAAITSMLSGHHEHESMMLQMEAADRWNYFQATRIKALLREERIENLEMNGGKVPESLRKKIGSAKEDRDKIKAEAEGLESASHRHDNLHMIFAAGVTLFQVAIAVAAISALTKRKQYWFVGLAMGVIALGFMASGLLVWSGAVSHYSAQPPAEHAAQ